MGMKKRGGGEALQSSAPVHDIDPPSSEENPERFKHEHYLHARRPAEQLADS
jgi:hypothetical protein